MAQILDLCFCQLINALVHNEHIPIRINIVDFCDNAVPIRHFFIHYAISVQNKHCGFVVCRLKARVLLACFLWIIRCEFLGCRSIQMHAGFITVTHNEHAVVMRKNVYFIFAIVTGKMVCVAGRRRCQNILEHHKPVLFCGFGIAFTFFEKSVICAFENASSNLLIKRFRKTQSILMSCAFYKIFCQCIIDDDRMVRRFLRSWSAPAGNGCTGSTRNGVII